MIRARNFSHDDSNERVEQPGAKSHQHGEEAQPPTARCQQTQQLPDGGKGALNLLIGFFGLFFLL